MDERSTDRIEREIAHNRAEMSETIDAIERKLSPGELFDELWGRVRGGETGSNVAETIRDHPIPLAMMGLGLGWLAIETASGSRTEQLRGRHGGYSSGSHARAEGRVGPYHGDDVIDPDLRYGDDAGAMDRVRDAAGTLKDRVTGLAGDAKDRLSSMGETARDRVEGLGSHDSDETLSYDSPSGSGLRDRVTDLRGAAGSQMHHARDMMQDRGRQMERGFQQVLEDYPLALGAVTFGLGLAAGLSVPATQAENRVMGDTATTPSRGRSRGPPARPRRPSRRSPAKRPVRRRARRTARGWVMT